MSGATHNIHIAVTTSGLDTAGTAIKNISTSSGMATKSTDALGSSFMKTQTGAIKLSSGVGKVGKEVSTTTSTTKNYTKATDSAGKSTQGFAQKFQGNRGAIFAFVGMATAGAEAIGMFGMYQAAADKLSQAQERVNMLEKLGAQGTSAYKNAVQDVTEAQRGYNFILRNVALSFGDIIPFGLLAINAIVKMRDTLTSSKPAIDAATQATTGLGTAAKNTASSGLTPLVTSASNLGGGLTTLGTGVRNTTVATDQLFTSSGKLVGSTDEVGRSVKATSSVIGSKSSGLVAGISALDLAMNQSQKTSNKFTSVFRAIGEQFKSIPSILSDVASRIGGFFTNFSGSMTKFGSVLKAAGVAVMGFSKTMLLAFLSNPITAAIAAISAAVLALATDFGGIRTAINNFGVAIGNAVPQVKGLLDMIGGAANGALDYVANLLGVEKQTDSAGEAALRASPKFVQLTTAIKDSQTLGPIFDNLRKQVDNLHMGTDIYTKDSVIGYKNVQTSAETSLTAQQKKIPEVAAVLKELAAATTDNAVKGKTLAQVQANLNSIITKLQTALVGTAAKQNTLGKSTQQNATIANEAALNTTKLSESTINLATSMALAAADGKGVGITLSANEQALQKWLQTQGISITDTEALTAADDKLIQSLVQIAPALEENAQHIALLNGTSIDWTKTIGNIVVAHDNLAAKGEQTWSVMKEQIDKYGVEGLKAVEAGIKFLEDAHHPLAETMRKTFEEAKDELIEQGKYTEYLGTKEENRAKKRESYAEKEKKDLQETTEELGYKADQYNILDDIQNKSLETQQAIIDYYNEEKKSGEELVATLQQMALARGLSAEQVTEDTASLLKYIETHKLEKITTDEIIGAVAKEVDQRQQHARAMGLQEAAANHFLAQMKESIQITGMSGEGLMKYVDIIFEAKRATEIAADSIGLWYGELGKSQAVEEATRKKLEEFAEIHNVKIPNSIRKGSVAAFQEYVDEVMNIALKTDEAMQQIRDAVDEGVNHLTGSFNKISSDAGKAFSEGGKEFRKFLKETGLDPNNPLVLQGIVDMVMNDTTFEDDFTGFTENLAARLGDLKGATKGEITTMVKDWNATISSEMKDNPEAVAAIQAQSDKIISTMNTILNSGQGVKPIEAFVAAIGQVLGKDDAVKMAEQLGIKIPPALADKLKAGKNAITTGTKQGIYDPLAKELEGATSLVGKEGESAIAMYGQSIEGGKQLVQNAVLAGAVDPTTGEIQKVPGEAEKALQPVEGVFSDAFLKASTASTGQLNSLFASIYDGLTHLLTNTQTQLSAIESAWTDHATNIGTYVENIKTQLLLLQQTFSSLSSNVLTYTTSMGGNILTFATNAVTNLTTLNDYVFNTLQLTLSNLSTNVLTYMTSMETNILQFTTNSVANFTTLNDYVFNTLQLTFSNLSTSIQTYMTSMGTNITNFANVAKTAFANAGTAATGFQAKSSTLSTTIATHAKSMGSNLQGFASAAKTHYGAAGTAATGFQGKSSTLSSTFSSHMSSMTSKVKSFSSAAVSAFNAVGKAADANAKKVAALRKEIDALKSKTITITVNYKVNKPSGVQHGGAFIASKATQIDGVNIAEHNKPELIAAFPLTNPNNIQDRTIDIPAPNLKMPSPQIKSPSQVSVPSSSSSGGGQPVIVRGDQYIEVKLGDGSVIARAVKPYLLEGYSGISSS